MSTYNFVWPHEAKEVYVTGTFDDWSKSEKLEKTSKGFEKEVKLPKVDEKILYKFVVDGTWTTDHTAPSEKDHEGNVNNVLTPDHLLSSAAPTSTTAALAGQVPLEKTNGPSSFLPGQFPETPANENRDFSVNPIPATAGAGNPVKLAPGEKVPDPSSYTSGTLDSNVKLDKESYEKGGSGVPTLPPVLSKQEEQEAAGAAMFGVPPVTGTMIPESSLPMGDSVGKSATDPTISSAAPGSTTSQLAGQQPIEPRGVPEVVTESQQEAQAAPEASASSEAVKEKSQVENELLSKVPEEKPTSESGALGSSEKGILGVAAGGVAAAGAAAAGVAYAAKDKVVGPAETKPIEAPSNIAPSESHVNGVPETVTESQEKARADPEAAANPEAVKEKSEVERELESKIKPVNDSGEPAPTESAALFATAPVKPTDESTPAPTSDKADAPGRSLLPGKANSSRDISPMTRPGEPSAAGATATVTGPTTPQKNKRTSSFFKKAQTPDSQKTADSAGASPADEATKKANKRKSFFGKIKEKLKS